MPGKPILINDEAFTVRTEFPDVWETPTAVAIRAFDTTGVDLLERDTGSITLIIDDNDSIKCSASSHGREIDDIVTLSATTNYNTIGLVTDKTAGTFIAGITYVADESSGTWTGEKKATVYQGAVLGSAASRGAASIVLSTDVALYEDDLIMIGSTSEGFDVVRVRAYVSATKTVTLQDRLDYDHASGVAVVGRWASYDLNTIGALWQAATKEVTLEWVCVGADNLPLTELREIQKRVADFSGLETHFRERFSRLHPFVEERWETWQEDAHRRLQQYFRVNGVDIDRAVDSDYYTESMLLEIAVMVCEGGGESLDGELDRLLSRRTNQNDIMKNLFMWVDVDQDLVKDEGEESPAKSIGIARGL